MSKRGGSLTPASHVTTKPLMKHKWYIGKLRWDKGFLYTLGKRAQWSVGHSRYYRRIVLGQKDPDAHRFKTLKNFWFSTIAEAQAKAVELDQ
jgi:hypothetical protein